MRFKSLTAAALAATIAMPIAAPASAQETRQPSTGERILGSILQRVLGPAEQPQQDEAANVEGTAAAVDINTVLADSRRDDDRARDAWRNPAQTLQFFQVQPSMTVVDYMPAGGWYTRVLVPYLGANGRYLGVVPDPAAADGERFANYFGGLPADFRENAGDWSLTGAPYAVVSSDQLNDAMDGTVDRVLIFREMHNLLRSGAMYTELTRLRDLLKADGMLGIVQHRAPETAPADYTLGSNGYLRQRDVVALVEAHGFQLVSTSEVNANPNDTADHEGGVWTRAPSYRGADEGTPERAAAEAIGESDRMTLLFRKR
jgi:predicted methyltransferase